MRGVGMMLPYTTPFLSSSRTALALLADIVEVEEEEVDVETETGSALYGSVT